jgi:hypothetical protein
MIMRRLVRCTFFSMAVLFGALSSAAARTWFVAADGSGDAPTIEAAVDSSSAGDVILVGPGIHYVAKFDGAVLMKPFTTLVSNAGPTVTFLRRGASYPPAQPSLVGAQDGCVISGFSMEGGVSSAIGVSGDGVEVSNNIINSANGGVGILVNGTASIHHNLIYGGFAGITLALFDSLVQIFCNILLDGVYSGNSDCPPLVWAYCNLMNGQQSCFIGYANFSADPLFCGVGNYYLRADSPCAPGNHPDGFDCGLIGPLPVGCGTVRVEEKTWGAVKALYKE